MSMEVSFTSRNFSTHLKECFQDFFISKDLTDVTLVFDDRVILEFLYKGEVRIARDSVEEFLSEAEDLQISQFLLDTTEVSSLRPDIGQNSLQTEAGQADHQIKLFQESAAGETMEGSIVEPVDNLSDEENSRVAHQ